MKRAAAGIGPAKDTSLKKATSAQPAQQKTSAPGSPQKKASTPAAQPSKADVTKGPDGVKQTGPAPGQKTPSESRKAGPLNHPDQKNQTAPKQGNATAAPQQESAGLFGFGGSKTQTSAAKPAETVTGKMFGFGSSIFSSASTLISSSVQDDSKTTPPVSPKISATKDSISPSARKPEQEKKTEHSQQAKSSLPTQQKGDKTKSEPSPKTSAHPAAAKAVPSACPLCKVELNVGSKDPPNYNSCTMCKNTVCNQCGFNPSPNVTEVR